MYNIHWDQFYRMDIFDFDNIFKKVSVNLSNLPGSFPFQVFFIWIFGFEKNVSREQRLRLGMNKTVQDWTKVRGTWTKQLVSTNEADTDMIFTKFSSTIDCYIISNDLWNFWRIMIRYRTFWYLIFCATAQTLHFLCSERSPCFKKFISSLEEIIQEH